MNAKPKCALGSSRNTRSLKDIARLYLSQHALLGAFDRAFVRAGEVGLGVLGVGEVVENYTLITLAAQEISKRYWRPGSRERAYVLR